MAAENDTPLIITVEDGVATMRLNRPKKLNSYDGAQRDRAFQRFAADPEVKAVIITGTGKVALVSARLDAFPDMLLSQYFSSGADFGETPSAALMLQPQTWRCAVADRNYMVFLPYITFPKPIIAAVNGPAIGMAVTTASLADFVIATPTATFCTPFKKVGVPPEGCSSINFERRFGKENAAVLLEKGDTIDVETAKRFGLVQEIAPDTDTLLQRAKETRPLVRESLVEKFKAVNWEESMKLADWTINPTSGSGLGFFANQYAMSAARGKPVNAMWYLSKMCPIFDTVQSVINPQEPKLRPEKYGALKSRL